MFAANKGVLDPGVVALPSTPSQVNLARELNLDSVISCRYGGVLKCVTSKGNGGRLLMGNYSHSYGHGVSQRGWVGR